MFLIFFFDFHLFLIIGKEIFIVNCLGLISLCFNSYYIYIEKIMVSLEYNVIISGYKSLILYIYIFVRETTPSTQYDIFGGS